MSLEYSIKALESSHCFKPKISRLLISDCFLLNINILRICIFYQYLVKNTVINPVLILTFQKKHKMICSLIELKW